MRQPVKVFVVAARERPFHNTIHTLNDGEQSK